MARTLRSPTPSVHSASRVPTNSTRSVATQQEISRQQAKAEKTIQQQAKEAQEKARQKIQEEANQQQEQAEQKIREQADQAKQQAGPREREVIDKLAQQEIDKQNQAIEKKVKEEAKQKEKSSGQEDKEKFLESKSSDPRLTALRKDLQKTKGVDTVTLPLVNNKGDAAVYTVTATTAPSSRATEDLVSTLRNDVIPKATKGEQMGADVGGTTATYIDLASEISSKLPLVIGIVLSFMLLLLAFRSLLVPLKAVVMNVFSILAAFGVVTYAFNHDWTARLIGLEGPIPIVSFVPLMMFAILFGLSMDYEA